MLSDAHKRALYDRGGERAMKEGGLGSRGGGGGFGSPMDIFDLFFGGGVRMRGRADRRGTGIRDPPGPRGGRGLVPSTVLAQEVTNVLGPRAGRGLVPSTALAWGTRDHWEP